ncbi:MAG: peptide deformylase [Treponema sp.]|nr:peptide deformylase [Treponema sp.]
MILDVVKLGDEILRKKAEAVPEVNDEIRKLAEDMFETMIDADGVGLACPQIGKSLRMFVCMADDDVRRVFINPQIIKTSQETGEYDEGCLSIPQVYETIVRPVAITVQALNEHGRPFTLDADGLLARIIQHEYDHLDGILYIDRGDKDFAAKTEEQFKKRAERAAQKAKEKESKARKIAAKIAAKEAKKNKK